MKRTTGIVLLVVLAGLASAQEFETFIPLPDSSTPYAGAWSPTQNRVYISNTGTNKVVVIDGASNSIVTFLSAGAAPQAVAWHPNNDRVYVGNIGDSTLTVIDCASNSVVKTIQVGAWPGALVSDSANDKVFTADLYSGTVSVIDAAADSLVATVNVGPYPIALALAPQVNRLYVAVEGSDEVVSLNAQTNLPNEPEPVGQYPWSLAYDPMSRKVYVACYGSNTVDVLDAAIGRRTKVITGVGTEPHSLAYGGGFVYCANQRSNDVAVISTLNDTLVRKIRFSSGDKPKRMLWEPSKSKMYCALSGGTSVAVLQDGALLKTVGARPGPEGMVLNSTDRRVYVACYPTDTVVVLRDSTPGGIGELPAGSADGPGVLTAYPQPARGWFYLETQGFAKGRLSAYDSQGRLWGRWDVASDGVRMRADFRAPSGVYLLRLEPGDGQAARVGRILAVE